MIKMIPWWINTSIPAFNNDWNQPSYDLREYFPYSSRPSSLSTITSEDEVKWRIEYDRAVKRHRTDHLEFDHGFYIDIHNIVRPSGWIPASFLHPKGVYIPITVVVIPDMIGQRTPVSPPTQALWKIYSITSGTWSSMDNWTANHSPHGTPDSHASTIATHATWYSDDPLPDDGAANVVKVNAIKHHKDLCILDSDVFNNES